MTTDRQPVSVAWMPLSADPRLHRDTLAAAGRFGVEALHLSHAICHDADDLLDDAPRAARVAALVNDCRRAGLRVWCWTHEVCKPPPECLRDGKLVFDAPELWSHLETKYTRFLRDVLPDLDGLVLTCAETDYLVYHDTHLHSRRTRAARTTRLARELHAITARHGRRLVLRDFVYRRAEVEDMAQAIANCPAELAVMTKSVPHDWHPFYPPNPLLGAVGGREQWMELDFGHEYEGQHLYPYAEVEATLTRLRHGHARGVRHFVARLDRAANFCGASALHTPWGGVELLALQRFVENPGVTAEAIWKEWEATQWPGARRAVELATSAVQHLLFPMRFWYADHSRLPTYEYAASHLVDGNADRLPTWTGNRDDADREAQFRQLSPAWVAELREEADIGLRRAIESAALIRRSAIPRELAAPWRAGASSLIAWLELFAKHREVFFSLELARRHPGEVSTIELDRELDQLERLCTAWTPRLAGQQLENEGATDHFSRALASLRAARAELRLLPHIAVK